MRASRAKVFAAAALFALYLAPFPPVVSFAAEPDQTPEQKPDQKSDSAPDPGLNPEEGRYFILSVVFELKTVPRATERIPLVAKIANYGHAADGYGISLYGFSTSTRPQLFWSSGGTDGGWFTFGDYAFKPRHRYALTIVSRPREFVSMYLQERGRDIAKDEPLGSADSEMVFLGGQDLTGVSTPHNEAPFSYHVPAEGAEEAADRRGGGNAVILGAAIASPEKFEDSRDKLSTALKGAPEELTRLTGRSDIRLWEISAPTPEKR